MAEQLEKKCPEDLDARTLLNENSEEGEYQTQQDQQNLDHECNLPRAPAELAQASQAVQLVPTRPAPADSGHLEARTSGPSTTRLDAMVCLQVAVIDHLPAATDIDYEA